MSCIRIIHYFISDILFNQWYDNFSQQKNCLYISCCFYCTLYLWQNYLNLHSKKTGRQLKVDYDRNGIYDTKVYYRDPNLH